MPGVKPYASEHARQGAILSEGWCDQVISSMQRGLGLYGRGQVQERVALGRVRGRAVGSMKFAGA